MCHHLAMHPKTWKKSNVLYVHLSPAPETAAAAAAAAAAPAEFLCAAFCSDSLNRISSYILGSLEDKTCHA